jgi:hypothetical protein
MSAKSKWISKCVEQSTPLPAWTQITCVDETHPLPARTEIRSQLLMQARTKNASQLVLTNSLPCMRAFKRISICVDKTHPMPAKSQNASQHVLTLPARTKNASHLLLTKSLLFQLGHKIHLNM